MCAAARLGHLEGEKTNGIESSRAKLPVSRSSASAGANCGEVTLTHDSTLSVEIGVEIKTTFNLTSDGNLTSALPVNQRDALRPMA